MFTFSVKESRDAQFIFGDVEGVVEVSEVVVGVEVSVVDEIGAVRVNESVETQTIAPARREVGDISRYMRVAERTQKHTLTTILWFYTWPIRIDCFK